MGSSWVATASFPALSLCAGDSGEAQIRIEYVEPVYSPELRSRSLPGRRFDECIGNLATCEPIEYHIRSVVGQKIVYRLTVSGSSISATRPYEKAHVPGTSVRTLSIAAMISPAMAKWEAIDEIWLRKVSSP